jgi:hypothetical protein
MGGVADCMGLSYAAYLTYEGASEREAGDFQARLLLDRHGRQATDRSRERTSPDSP